MKSIFLFLLLLFFTGLASFKHKQTKYLPIYIGLTDTTSFRSDILLSLKAAFNSRKIKTISKDETGAYVKTEVTQVLEDYIKNGGDMGDFDKQKKFLSANMHSVATCLLLSFTIQSDGIVNDTVKWYSYAIPIDFENPPKNIWHSMLLDSTNSSSLSQITQSIADSIIASNVLIKE